MSDTKLSDLAAVTTVDDTDVYYVGRSGVSKKITGANLKAGTATDTSGLYAAGGTDVAVADGGTGASSASAARTNLGVVIGTDVEAHDADLTTIAGLSPSNDDVLQRKAGAWANRTIAQLLTDLAAAGTTFQPLDSDLTAFAGLAVAADKLPYGTGSHTLGLADLTSFARTLLDDADAATARKTLGVATKDIQLKVMDDATVVTTGDGKIIFCIPASLNGFDLTAAAAFVTTVSSSGLPTVQIRNITQTADMLTTKVSIDASEFTSYTAATAAVIDTGNDDVATGDLIAIDVDVAGTGAKGLGVILTFTLP